MVKPLTASLARRVETDLKLMSAVRHRGFPDCNNRDADGYCICINRYMDNPADRDSRISLVVGWENCLLTVDGCFLYVGDESSEASF